MSDDQQRLIILGAKLDKQRRLLQRVQCAYETERREWARLLHDEFGQSLAAIKSFAVGIRNNTDTAADAHELAGIIQTTANELYVSAYDLMRGLRSGFIDDMGLLGGIQMCIQNSRLAQQGIQVQIQSAGKVDYLGHLLNVVILRIVQECLSGIVRSSNSSEITISIDVRQHKHAERRKSPRSTNTELAAAPPPREILELHMSSNALDRVEFDNHRSIFERTQDYVEAFGGNYAVKQIDNTSIEIQVSLDITDLIEDEAE